MEKDIVMSGGDHVCKQESENPKIESLLPTGHRFDHQRYLQIVAHRLPYRSAYA